MVRRLPVLAVMLACLAVSSPAAAGPGAVAGTGEVAFEGCPADALSLAGYSADGVSWTFAATLANTSDGPCWGAGGSLFSGQWDRASGGRLGGEIVPGMVTLDAALYLGGVGPDGRASVRICIPTTHCANGSATLVVV